MWCFLQWVVIFGPWKVFGVSCLFGPARTTRNRKNVFDWEKMSADSHAMLHTCVFGRLAGSTPLGNYSGTGQGPWRDAVCVTEPQHVHEQLVRSHAYQIEPSESREDEKEKEEEETSLFELRTRSANTRHTIRHGSLCCCSTNFAYILPNAWAVLFLVYFRKLHSNSIFTFPRPRP